MIHSQSLASGSDPNCLFCKIIAGSIPSTRVYEDDDHICIRDIQPQAKTHLLVIPKRHVASLDEVFPSQGDALVGGQVMSKLFEAALRIARQEGLLPGGFRSIINTGKEGGQTVFHLHLHLLAGSQLDESLVYSD